MGINDFFNLAMIYYEMADFLEKEGKSGAEMRKLGYQMKLRVFPNDIGGYKESGVVKGIEILATDDSCLACRQLNHKRFSLEETESKKPLPVQSCTYKYGCRCVYLPDTNSRP